jgi:hypothetical protein
LAKGIVTTLIIIIIILQPEMNVNILNLSDFYNRTVGERKRIRR